MSTDEVKWVYIGRRRSNPVGPPTYAWAELADVERVHYFAKVKATAVGYIYTVKVERDDNGEISAAYSNPTYDGDPYGDPDRIAAWQAIDQQARRDDSRRKAEARAARAPELELALNPLRHMLRNARSFNEVEAIMSLVRTKMFDEWGKGKLS